MRDFCLRFAANRYGVAAALYVLVLILVMLVIEATPGSDPHEISSAVMQPPSASHTLGTDELGRDVLLGILHGIRVSLAVGFAAALCATTIGMLVGATAGFDGGLLRLVLLRVSRGFEGVPSFNLAAL